MPIPKKVDQRIQIAFTKLRSVLQEAKNRDVNEADTVTLVKAILSRRLRLGPVLRGNLRIRNPQHVGGSGCEN
jgi:hypothetical protein